MASTSPTSLSERAEAITRRNNETAPLPPPPVAAQSPFHEVLMGENVASLPGELKARMEASLSVGDVCDWIAAGAVYRWIHGDSYLSRIFLDEVSNDPKRAGLALAKALAAHMEPPQRDAPWHRCDRLGLALQLVVVGIILVCRGLLFSFLGHHDGSYPPQSRLAEFLLGIVGLPFITGETPNSLLAATMLSGATVWLGVEAIVAPRIMECVRQLPAQRKKLPPPLAWRIDAFYMFWFAQVAILLVCVGIRGLVSLAYITVTNAIPGVQRSIALVIGVIMIAIIWWVIASARSILRLGSNALQVQV